MTNATATPKAGDTLDCGHVLPEREAGSCATGYGSNRDGRTYCYPCCAERDRATVARGEMFVGYVASDGRSVTNWPGDALLRIYRTSESRTGWHGSKLLHVSAVDDRIGRRWHGKGAGLSMCVRMHPSKLDA
jgi:hypothetical protein